MSFQRPADYAGEVSVSDAYALLRDDEQAVLVDVRTKAEWTYVGVPDLSGLGRTPILIEWQSYPAMQVAADFTPRLIAELTRARRTPERRCCSSVARASARWRRRGRWPLPVGDVATT